MAVVYRARDLRHDRMVAIKVVRPEVREHIGGERFLREIQVAARLQHPHIVPLYDSGAAAGHVYYVMPLLSGESLRDRLDREGPLSLEEALRLTVQVARALDYAHRHGVIHRDIKPDNILLHEDSAMVADFGIALAVQGASDQRLTATGFAVGTPVYMSPEQATGDRPDPRSDIYSLGCVLYEMLTDQLPYTAASAPELVALKLTEPPRALQDLRPNLPAYVIQAVSRSLERKPADRYSTASEFARALGDQTATPAESSVGSPRRRSQSRWAGWITAGAVVLALVLWLGRGHPEPAPTPARHVKVTSSGGVTAAALSPDGRTLAFVSRTGDSSRLQLQDVDGESALELTATVANIGQVAWAPDGGRVFYTVDGGPAAGLFRIGRFGGAPEHVSRFATACLTPAADSQVEFRRFRPDTLWILPLAGGTPRPIPLQQPGDQLVGAAWSPTGERLALIMFDERTGRMTIQLISADGKDQYPVALIDTLEIHGVAWAPNGRALYVLQGGPAALIKFRLTNRGRPAGRPRVLLDGLQVLPADEPHALSVDASGRRLTYLQGWSASNLWIGEVTQTGRPLAARRLSSGTDIQTSVALAPNGRAVAHVLVRGAAFVQIRVLPLDGSRPIPMAPTDASGYQPAWSDDGTQIAFALDRPGDSTAIALADARSGLVRQTIQGTHIGGVRAITWNGDLLVYTGNGNRGLWLYDQKTGLETRLQPDSARFYLPRLSPDGRFLAVTTTGHGGNGFLSISLASGQGIRLGPRLADPLTWTSDGTAIFALDSGSMNGGRTIFRVPVAGGPVTIHTILPVSLISKDVTISADGRTAIYAAPETQADAWVIDGFDPDVPAGS